ncbi:MAG: SDR family NAD(P)-dependent oxidoreductase [Erysipelotrichaceae bacterium]|nr:SDR family NAD(P)-dependent oxidoreductase [Erysipelotrichaceae bacterium]
MANKAMRHFQKMDLPKGQTVVITGANSGIGFECARYLSSIGDHLIFAVRSLERGERAKEQILNEYPDANIEVWLLDLNDLASIESFIKRINDEKLDIDVFYSNAGIYRLPYAESFKGFERHMAVNYVSNLVLYHGLEEYFHSLPHRVKFILTSSVVARFAKLRDGDLFGEKKYSKSRAYKKSKLAVNHLYLWLCSRSENTNVLPLLVQPGSTFTPLIAKAYPGRFILAAKRFMRLAFHKPDKAALCTMRLLEKDVASPTYVAPRGIGHLTGYPKQIRLYRGNIGDPEHLIAETIRCLEK